MPGFAEPGQFVFFGGTVADLPIQLECQIEHQIDHGIIHGQGIQWGGNQQGGSFGESLQGRRRSKNRLGILFHAGNEGGPLIIQEAV